MLDVYGDSDVANINYAKQKTFFAWIIYVLHLQTRIVTLIYNVVEWKCEMSTYTWRLWLFGICFIVGVREANTWKRVLWCSPSIVFSLWGFQYELMTFKGPFRVRWPWQRRLGPQHSSSVCPCRRPGHAYAIISFLLQHYSLPSNFCHIVRFSGLVGD